MHIWLAVIAQKFLNLANNNIGCFYFGLNIHLLCGKVHYEKRGSSCYGFIILEDEDKIYVRKMNADIDTILKVKYDRNRDNLVEVDSGEKIAYNI